MGGLIGNSTGKVFYSYWDTTASEQQHSDGGQGKTTVELQTPTFYTGIYANWNLNLDGRTGGDDPWSFGTSGHYPVLKYGGLSVAGQGGAQSQPPVRAGGGSGAPTLTDPEIAELERAVLEFTYSQMGGNNWRNRTNWSTDAPLKDWHGVSVNAQGRVIALDLSNNNLTGHIPAELDFLPELQSLRLSGNATRSCIPRELRDPLLVGALLSDDGIERQALNDLPLIGVLPSIVENAAGSVASTVVSIAASSTAGSVASTAFSGLQMAENALQYNIGELNQPLCAPPLPNRKNYTGDLASLEAIRDYYIGQGVSADKFATWQEGNPYWHGVEVGTFEGQKRVIRLGLDDRGLTGNIAPEIANLDGLYYLNLSGNQLSGSIPPELGHLSNLRTLALNDNQLTSASREVTRPKLDDDGNVTYVTETVKVPIPPELANLWRLEKLYLQNNRLTGVMSQDLDLLTYTSLRVMDIDVAGDYALAGCLRPNQKFVKASVFPQITDTAIGLITGGVKIGAAKVAAISKTAAQRFGKEIAKETAQTIGENAASFAVAEVVTYMTASHDLGVIGEILSAVFAPSERVGELIGRLAEFFGFFGLGGEVEMDKVYCKGS